MATLASLLLPLLFLVAGEDEPPSPAERIATLRKTCAGKRVKLANWAKRKKLGTDARAQYLIAVHLCPDLSSARSRLGHRKGKDGTWSRDREKVMKDASGAREKHGQELTGREAALCREEAAAFAVLGEALVAEGHTAEGEPLLLRAFFLDPQNARAAAGLGLTAIRKGFGTPADAKVVREAPMATKAPVRGYLSSRMGLATKVMVSGSVTAEAESGGAALGELARLSDQAQRLTSLRFGLPLQGAGWLTVVVVRGQDKFNRFLDAAGVPEPQRSLSKRIGSTRHFQPRHCLGTWIQPAGDIGSAASIFVHEAAENQLFWYGGQHTPAWIWEVVGLDTCLTLLGQTGQLCIAYESSSGLLDKGAISDPASWPSLLLKRAATGRISRLEHMVTAKITGLGKEEIVTSHAYYRYLLLTQRAGLSKYLLAFVEEADSVANFVAAFEKKPDEITTALRTVLLGAPPIVPAGKPAGK